MRSIDRHLEARVGCGHHHGLLFAKPGELAPGAKRRQWRVALGAFTAQAATWPWGEPLLLARGTRLRYDQRDYDSALRHDAWDRFCVLDGPDAGRCVFLSALMPESPVAGGTSLIEPIDEECRTVLADRTPLARAVEVVPLPQDVPPKSTSLVSTVPAVRPGADW